jgi:peptidase E
MATYPKVMTLMNFQNSYSVLPEITLFQEELEWVFKLAGIHPTNALFISYAYNGSNYPQYFKDVSAIFATKGIVLTDITSGNPSVLIAAAKLIVIGGGDIATFMNKMNSLITSTFNPFTAIKDRVDNSVPYIGWNEGASIISPKYFTPPSNPQFTGIGASLPFQIVCNYQNSSLAKTTIFNFLNTNNTIKKVICQVTKPDGTSVRLEDSGAGMINSATDPYPTVINFEIAGGVLQES